MQAGCIVSGHFQKSEVFQKIAQDAEMPSPDALGSRLAFRKEMYQWSGQDSFWVPGHGPSPVQ